MQRKELTRAFQTSCLPASIENEPPLILASIHQCSFSLATLATAFYRRIGAALPQRGGLPSKADSVVTADFSGNYGYTKILRNENISSSISPLLLNLLPAHLGGFFFWSKLLSLAFGNFDAVAAILMPPCNKPANGVTLRNSLLILSKEISIVLIKLFLFVLEIFCHCNFQQRNNWHRRAIISTACN